MHVKVLAAISEPISSPRSACSEGNRACTKRDEILLIAASRGARNVRVFGSVARGDDDGRSDVPASEIECSERQCPYEG